MSQAAPFRNADDQEHDLGPWIETASTRCNAYRYDYATEDLYVKWRNGRGHVVTAYRAVGSETYRRFAQAASKGRFVGHVLDGFFYEPASVDEQDAPSNPNRREVKHRVEGAKIGKPSYKP